MSLIFMIIIILLSSKGLVYKYPYCQLLTIIKFVLWAKSFIILLLIIAIVGFFTIQLTLQVFH